MCMGNQRCRLLQCHDFFFGTAREFLYWPQLARSAQFPDSSQNLLTPIEGLPPSRSLPSGGALFRFQTRSQWRRGLAIVIDLGNHNSAGLWLKLRHGIDDASHGIRIPYPPPQQRSQY